jgi:hypothetical protein
MREQHLLQRVEPEELAGMDPAEAAVLLDQAGRDVKEECPACRSEIGTVLGLSPEALVKLPRYEQERDRTVAVRGYVAAGQLNAARVTLISGKVDSALLDQHFDSLFLPNPALLTICLENGAVISVLRLSQVLMPAVEQKCVELLKRILPNRSLNGRVAAFEKALDDVEVANLFLTDGFGEEQKTAALKALAKERWAIADKLLENVSIENDARFEEAVPLAKLAILLESPNLKKVALLIASKQAVNPEQISQWLVQHGFEGQSKQTAALVALRNEQWGVANSLLEGQNVAEDARFRFIVPTEKTGTLLQFDHLRKVAFLVAEMQGVSNVATARQLVGFGFSGKEKRTAALVTLAGEQWEVAEILLKGERLELDERFFKAVHRNHLEALLPYETLRGLALLNAAKRGHKQIAQVVLLGSHLPISLLAKAAILAREINSSIWNFICDGEPFYREVLYMIQTNQRVHSADLGLALRGAARNHNLDAVTIFLTFGYISNEMRFRAYRNAIMVGNLRIAEAIARVGSMEEHQEEAYAIALSLNAEILMGILTKVSSRLCVALVAAGNQ